MVSLGKLGSAPTTPTSHDDTKHSDSGEHILRDGTVAFTGNLDMDGNDILNVDEISTDTISDATG